MTRYTPRNGPPRSPLSMQDRYVAYYRVSTHKQDLSLDAQRADVLRFAGSSPVIAEFMEKESGKDDKRPQLQAAISHCLMTGSTLLVAKLDRLSRNVSFLSALMEDAVRFVAVDAQFANSLTIHMLAAIAEYEREQISARTKAALAITRQRGQKLGRDNPRIKEYAKAGGDAAAAKAAVNYSKRVRAICDRVRAMSAADRVSYERIAAVLANDHDYVTSRGNPISKPVVMRALACSGIAVGPVIA